MKAAWIIVPLSAMIGCSGHLEHSSPIVEKAETAGAGDLKTASIPSIEYWLRKHRDLAEQIDIACKGPRETADAKWLDTTEGRLCAAARNVEMYSPKNLKKSDGQTFEPGLK